MKTLTIVVLVIGLLMVSMMLGIMMLMVIRSRNERNHGTWWGNSPEWLCQLMNLLP